MNFNNLDKAPDYANNVLLLVNVGQWVMEPGQRSRYRDLLRVRGPSPGRAKNFPFPISSRPAPGPTQPHIQWVSEVLSPGVKQLRREADH
jgi:hypothetical protein